MAYATLEKRWPW